MKKRMLSLALALTLVLALAPAVMAAEGDTFIAIAESLTTEYSGIALKSDGSLWFFETPHFIDYNNAKIGHLITTKLLDDVTAIASNYLALRTDGSLWAWGNNNYGRLGDGTTTDHDKPIKVMDNVVSISSSGNSSFAIKADGSLWAWGDNPNGMLGDRSQKAHHSPIKVMDDVIAVSSNGNSIFAVKTDGNLWAWGGNAFGSLGDGTEETHSSDSPVMIMNDVVAVSSAGYTSFAIKTDGSLWGWGLNHNGTVGDGTGGTLSDSINHLLPVHVMNDVTAVDSGVFHVGAIKTDGSLWMWGVNTSGQIGDGTKENKNAPTKVMDDITAVSVGRNNTYAIKTDGRLWGWGFNYSRSFDDRLPITLVLSEVKPDPEPEPEEPAEAPTGWSAESVNALIAEGLVPVALQGKYAAKITRAEFFSLSVAVYETYMGKTITESASFPDDEGIEDVRKMAGLGVVTGGGSGVNPHGTFSRAHAAVMFVKLLDVMGIELPKVETTFNDKASIASWAVEQVGQAQAAGLVSGSGGNYNPGETFSRQEAMALMWKLWDWLQK